MHLMISIVMQEYVDSWQYSTIPSGKALSKGIIQSYVRMQIHDAWSSSILPHCGKKPPVEFCISIIEVIMLFWKRRYLKKCSLVRKHIFHMWEPLGAMYTFINPKKRGQIWSHLERREPLLVISNHPKPTKYISSERHIEVIQYVAFHEEDAFQVIEIGLVWYIHGGAWDSLNGGPRF